jgi:hypothetical protein
MQTQSPFSRPMALKPAHSFRIVVCAWREVIVRVGSAASMYIWIMVSVDFLTVFWIGMVGFMEAVSLAGQYHKSARQTSMIKYPCSVSRCVPQLGKACRMMVAERPKERSRAWSWVGSTLWFVETYELRHTALY